MFSVIRYQITVLQTKRIKHNWYHFMQVNFDPNIGKKNVEKRTIATK